MAAKMGSLALPRTPYAVSSARNNFKIDRYLNFSTGQISDRYWGVVLQLAYGWEEYMYLALARPSLRYYSRSYEPGSPTLASTIEEISRILIVSPMCAHYHFHIMVC